MTSRGRLRLCASQRERKDDYVLHTTQERQRQACMALKPFRYPSQLSPTPPFLLFCFQHLAILLSLTEAQRRSLGIAQRKRLDQKRLDQVGVTVARPSWSPSRLPGTQTRHDTPAVAPSVEGDEARSVYVTYKGVGGKTVGREVVVFHGFSPLLCEAFVALVNFGVWFQRMRFAARRRGSSLGAPCRNG